MVSTSIEQEGIRLSRFRKTTGMTQVEFAKLLGCSQPNLNKIEKGVTGISSSMRNKIFEIFPQISPNWLQSGLGIMLMDKVPTPSLGDIRDPKTIVSASESFILQIQKVKTLFEEGKIPMPAMLQMLEDMRRIMEIQKERIEELQEDKEFLKTIISSSKNSPFSNSGQ